MEDLRWEVLRLKEEVRAMRRELGEARGAREEMVSIYNISTHIQTFIHICTYLHILGQDIQADAGRHAAALQAEPRHKGHVTRDTLPVIYVIILSNGAGGLKC